MGDIVKFNKEKTAEFPDHVLEKSKGNYKSVFVIGWDNDGILDVRSTTNLDQKEILWMIEVFKNKLLNGDYAP